MSHFFDFLPVTLYSKKIKMGKLDDLKGPKSATAPFLKKVSLKK
jgi:hypothetical protein